jgi:UDP-N-acetyl-D-mannosaminuronate dehydrogenase
LGAVNICVPSPLRKIKDPDLTFVKKVVETVAKNCLWAI